MNLKIFWNRYVMGHGFVPQNADKPKKPAVASMVKQCSIIFGCLAGGEFLAWGLSVPVPGSIIGLLILAGLLQARIVRLESVKFISNFLISNMGFFFVPPGVALMLYFGLIAKEWVPITVATVGSIILVLLATGAVHQLMHRRYQRQHNPHHLHHKSHRHPREEGK